MTLPSVWSISLDAIYNSPVGTSASFAAFAGSVRVVDKTSGVDLMPINGGGSMPTVEPAVMVRRSTLDAKGVTPAQLVGTLVTFNALTWKIINHKPAPQPDGEAGGEYRLILRKP